MSPPLASHHLLSLPGACVKKSLTLQYDFLYPLFSYKTAKEVFKDFSKIFNLQNMDRDRPETIHEDVESCKFSSNRENIDPEIFSSSQNSKDSTPNR